MFMLILDLANKKIMFTMYAVITVNIKYPDNRAIIMKSEFSLSASSPWIIFNNVGISKNNLIFSFA